MGRGWPFYFFPGMLQGSVSLAGVDFFRLRGWPFYFFPGVLQGSFSLPGVDVFLFRGGLFFLCRPQGGLFSFAGWTFVLCRGGLFSFAGWIRIRCRELREYSVPIQPSCRRLDEKNKQRGFPPV